MHTTLDIDDDVQQAARKRARRVRKTAGQVISALLRRVFTAPVDPAVVREVASVYGVQPFPPSGRLVTNDVIDALRGDDAY